MFKPTAILTIFLFLHSCSTVSTRDPDTNKSKFGIQKAKAEIEEFHKARNLKHIGFAIYSKDEGTVWGTLGKAPAHARFKVGSVTKIFTAIGIFQLRDSGMLNLDDPVIRYIPEFKNVRYIGSKPESEPTIRDLLFHNSGLQGDIHHEFFLDTNTSQELTIENFHNLPSRLGEVSRDKRNQVWSYSNIAFSLLGIIIERKSGQNIEDYFQKEILEKAGMTHSSLLENLKDKKKDSKMIEGYLGMLYPTRTPGPIIRDLTAGSLSTTPRDMSEFLKTFLVSSKKDGKLLSHKSYLEMIQGQMIPALNLEADFGLPVFRYKRISTVGDYYYVGHAGSLPPFIANLLWDPNGESAIFIATNTVSLRTGELVPFSHEVFEKLTSSQSGIKIEKPSISERVEDIPQLRLNKRETNNRLKTYSGIYSSPMGIMELRSESKDEAILNWGGLDFQVVREKSYYNLRLRLLFGFIKISTPGLENLSLGALELNENQHLVLFAENIRMGELGIAERITEVPKNPKHKNKLGRYILESPNSWDVVQEVIVDYDKRGFYKAMVTMQLNGMDNKQEFALAERNETSFVTFGKGRGLGEILEFHSDGSLLYSGYRLIKNR